MQQRGACLKHSKQSLSHSPEGAKRQTTRGYNVYSVLFTCTYQRSPLSLG